MTELVQLPTQNALLDSLSDSERQALVELCTRVSLHLGKTLYKSGEHIKYVYLVSSGVVSHVAHLMDGASVEVGLVGNEGIVGYPLALGDDISPDHAIVQIAGGALRIPAAAFLMAFEPEGKLHHLVLHFVLAMNQQIAQTAACNGSHPISERLARWLLMCHDRVEGDELLLTQEFIAQMLGTRRTGVGQAAGVLQTAGLIIYSRGRITILDRAGLEGVACECYGLVKANFARILASNN